MDAHCEDEQSEVGRDALEARVAAEKVLGAEIARVLVEASDGGGSGTDSTSARGRTRGTRRTLRTTA